MIVKNQKQISFNQSNFQNEKFKEEAKIEYNENNIDII